jgi:hypothetical protein
VVREGRLQSQIGCALFLRPCILRQSLAILIHFSIVHVQSGVWPMTVQGENKVVYSDLGVGSVDGMLPPQSVLSFRDAGFVLWLHLWQIP